MSQQRLFRILVVGNWIMQLLLHVLPISSWYSDPMIEKLMALDGYSAIFQWESPLVYQVSLWGFAIASAGMLFFKNWARYLYLLLWLYGWVATLIFGLRVSIPAQAFIGMAIGTIDGMVLYLAFMSTLWRDFKITKRAK